MARHVNRMGDPIAPGFLVAMPQLADSNFRRSVVLMLRHGDDGAFGLVINRPGEVTVAELCASQQIDYGGPSDRPMMVGGPVETEGNVIVLHGEPPDSAGGDEMAITDGIYLVTAREGLERLATRPGGRFRCYIGYSGWGPGQLDAELAEGSWIALPVQPNLVFHEQPDDVWETALRTAGIDPAALVPGQEIN